MIKLSYVSHREQVTQAMIHYVDQRLDHPVWPLLCWGSLLCSVVLLSWYQTRPTLDGLWVLVHAVIIALLFGRHSVCALLIRQNMQRMPWEEAHVTLILQGDTLSHTFNGTPHEIPRSKLLSLEACPEGFLLRLKLWSVIWIPHSAFPNRHTLRAMERWLQTKL